MEAHRLLHGFIGCEHLLLALTLQSSVASIFSDAGVRHDRVDSAVRRLVATVDLDASTLANIGIDLATVRNRVEESFGTGALETAAFL
ncbi:MAG: Clp protease N-terminal domain-containing protein [Actinomycetota bacterium]|nr:Clp protease N-terminal domain-containing protein [Actinomycetota bacterium]